MSLSKPYNRLWRPLKEYSPLSLVWYEDTPRPSLSYLKDERFASQAEIDSLVNTAHLIMRDLYEVFNYVEPHDDNLNIFSHRLYELLLRTATEFESNCKNILKANGYGKNEDKLNMADYFKITSAARLSEYKVIYERWASQHEFMPFDKWNASSYIPLIWYQDYNLVKHNRYKFFNKANLNNVMNAISGLLCILHAQIGENMDRVCFEGIGVTQMSQEQVSNGTFTIIAPVFSEEEQYDFIWDNIKGDSNPVNKYPF